MKFFRCIAFFAIPFTAHALSKAFTSGNTTSRYHPGPVSNVARVLLKDNGGFISLGDDGVIRSFIPNGTVIDYYQLDPEQVKQLAEKQYSVWATIGDVPESVSELAQPPYPDGRLVVNETQLLFPTDIPGTRDQQTTPSARLSDAPKRALDLLRRGNIPNLKVRPKDGGGSERDST
ncbi:hypothetical protein F5Y16DRAFT_403706 [Xylariaceae sp. FL0255]|nr:hypothetical protein F5Y16DRAFT_403706 [Xylariaceae sp. FL0255]